MNLTLKIWRQKDAHSPGRLVTYQAKGIGPAMSFLDMLDLLNEGLEALGKEPVAFDGDCREGTCGSCGCMIDGKANGPKAQTTLCQQPMGEFRDGDTIVIEPFRARAFPVIKDLVVDRSSLDRIIEAGGSIGVQTGHAPDANALPVSKADADRALDAAACIGCGACVASCPNASAVLFTGASVTHLGLLPQGQPERYERVDAMVQQMDAEDFGHCSNFGECTLACPVGISLDVISRLNRDHLVSQFKLRKP